MKNLKYASIITKLKGMAAKNLSKDDMFNLLKQTDLKSAVYVLKNEIEVLEDLDDNSDRIKIEQELDKIMINDILKISRLLSGSDKEIFYAYIQKYELKCIKTVIKNLTNNIDMNRNLYIVKLWTSKVFKKIDGIYDVKDFDELLNKLKKSHYYNVVKNYLDNFKETKNIPLFNIEVALDNEYFNNLLDKANDCDKMTKDLISKRIELLNLIYVYRIKKNYNSSVKDVKEFLVECNYKIKKQESEKIINSSNLDEMIDILNHSYYSKITKDIHEDDLKKAVNNYLYKEYKKGFTDSKYSISTIICYFGLEEYQEINIINILGGIIYNLPKDKIENKIIM